MNTVLAGWLAGFEINLLFDFQNQRIL